MHQNIATAPAEIQSSTFALKATFQKWQLQWQLRGHKDDGGPASTWL